MAIEALEEFLRKTPNTEEELPAIRFEMPRDPGDCVIVKPEEVDEFAAYLQSPTTHGFWKLTAAWDKHSDFTRFLYEQISPLLFADSTGKKPRPKYSDAERYEHGVTISRVLSTPLSLMNWAHQTLTDEVSAKELKDQSTIFLEFGECLTAKSIIEAFPKAYKSFTENIYFDGFVGKILPTKAARGKCGTYFVLRGPRSDDRISIISTKKSCLVTIKTFFEECGCISDATLDRVFAPEEEVFEPYFAFLSFAFPQLINDPRLKPQFAQAFDYFSKSDYHHCIGALGLIGEDYLTQIYESLLRSPCPKGLTLGQIYDGLHAEIRQLFQPQVLEPKNQDALYQLAKVLSSSSAAAETSVTLGSALREIAEILKYQKEHLDRRIDALKNREVVFSAFPARVRDNFTEFIRNRNATAHKTRIPIGSYEALRTLYCLTSIVMWWRTERRIIEWEDAKEVILRSAVARNSAKNW